MDWATNPPAAVSKAVDEVGQVLIGPFRLHLGALRGAAGLTSPLSAATIGGIGAAGALARTSVSPAVQQAWSLADAALSAYFSGDAAVGAYQAGKQAVERANAGDYEGAAEALGLGGAQGLFAYLGARNAVENVKRAGEIGRTGRLLQERLNAQEAARRAAEERPAEPLALPAPAETAGEVRAEVPAQPKPARARRASTRKPKALPPATTEPVPVPPEIPPEIPPLPEGFVLKEQAAPVETPKVEDTGIPVGRDVVESAMVERREPTTPRKRDEQGWLIPQVGDQVVGQIKGQPADGTVVVGSNGKRKVRLADGRLIPMNAPWRVKGDSADPEIASQYRMEEQRRTERKLAHAESTEESARAFSALPIEKRREAIWEIIRRNTAPEDQTNPALREAVETQLLDNDLDAQRAASVALADFREAQRAKAQERYDSLEPAQRVEQGIASPGDVIEVLADEVAKLTGEGTHRSGLSSSRYIETSDKRVRLSDHELPPTYEAQYGTPNWDVRIGTGPNAELRSTASLDEIRQKAAEIAKFLGFEASRRPIPGGSSATTTAPVVERGAPPAPPAEPPKAEPPAATATAGPKVAADNPERGSFSMKPISVVEQGAEYAAKPSLFRAAIDFLRPTESRIGDQGEAGPEVKRVLRTARDVGEREAGKRIAYLRDAGLMDLTREERFNLTESLQGIADPMNEKVQRIRDAVAWVFEETAVEAIERKMLVRERRTIRPGQPVPEGVKLTRGQQERLEQGKRVSLSYKRPFRKRAHFYPHIIPSTEALKRGAIRADVIENLQRMGVADTPERAAEMIEEYRSWIDKGGRSRMLEKYLIESGQATTPAEARALLEQFRKRAIRRQGSLEYARQVDLPFYDPDPLRVLPPWIHSASLRLAQVREFGQNNERLNKLIRDIDLASGDAAFARAAVDRILRMVEEPDNNTARLSRALRMLSGFKLGLSAIPNVTQGALNSLLASDIPSTLAGVKAVFSKEGWKFGERSGASLEGVINEMTRYAGAEGGALTTFLKAVGFTAAERANRVFAAAAGAKYLERLLDELKRGPSPMDRFSFSGGASRARKMIAELGVDPDALLERGSPTPDDILMAAKRFSDTTQFRSDPQDLPFFASSTLGKVVFQFKQYVYGQTRLLHREIIEEFAEGRYGKGTRALLVLAIAFPMAGEVIQDLRSLLTGRKRPGFGEPLQRYLDNIGATGALGVLDSVMSSAKYGRVGEWVLGPSLGQLATAIEAGYRDLQKGADTLADPLRSVLLKEAFRNIPFLGPLLANRVFSSGPQIKRKPGETPEQYRRRVAARELEIRSRVEWLKRTPRYKAASSEERKKMEAAERRKAGSE